MVAVCMRVGQQEARRVASATLWVADGLRQIKERPETWHKPRRSGSGYGSGLGVEEKAALPS